MRGWKTKFHFSQKLIFGSSHCISVCNNVISIHVCVAFDYYNYFIGEVGRIGLTLCWVKRKDIYIYLNYNCPYKRSFYPPRYFGSQDTGHILSGGDQPCYIWRSHWDLKTRFKRIQLKPCRHAYKGWNKSPAGQGSCLSRVRNWVESQRRKMS